MSEAAANRAHKRVRTTHISSYSGQVLERQEYQLHVSICMKLTHTALFSHASAQSSISARDKVSSFLAQRRKRLVCLGKRLVCLGKHCKTVTTASYVWTEKRSVLFGMPSVFVSVHPQLQHCTEHKDWTRTLKHKLTYYFKELKTGHVTKVLHGM